LSNLSQEEYLEIILKEQKNAKKIKNIGHLMNIEDPETFNQYIEELAMK